LKALIIAGGTPNRDRLTITKAELVSGGLVMNEPECAVDGYGRR
jgi:hypothetical protein